MRIGPTLFRASYHTNPPRQYLRYLRRLRSLEQENRELKREINEMRWVVTFLASVGGMVSVAHHYAIRDLSHRE